MEAQKTDQSPISPAQETLRSIYHTTIADPAFTFAGLSAQELRAHAVLALHDHDPEDAGWHAKKLCKELLDGFLSEGTYTALNNAVSLVYEAGDIELLSEVWYRREELRSPFALGEPIPVIGYMEGVHERYTDPTELRIALDLHQKGFEDIDQALYTHFIGRAALAKLIIAGDRRTLSSFIKSFDLDEAEDLRPGSNQVWVYQSVISLYETLSPALARDIKLRERIEGELQDFRMGLCKSADDERNHPRNHDVMLSAAFAVADLLDQDPDNLQFQAWHKKILRHFKWQDRLNIGNIWLANIRQADIELALNRLGDISFSQVQRFMIDTVSRTE